MADGIVFIEFDTHVLVSNPDVLAKLSRLYCDIFSLDPNFGEYRQCPVCDRYYSFKDVTENGVTSCAEGHRSIGLEVAWKPAEVAKEILQQSKEPGFHGVHAYLYRQLVGFAWVRVINFNTVRKHWGDGMVSRLRPLTKQDKVVYFDELGVGIKHRNMGFGKGMVAFISRWAKNRHPELMSVLRTHEKSRARKIFSNAGYRKFADDTEHGGGRIMMMVKECKLLTPERLN